MFYRENNNQNHESNSWVVVALIGMSNNNFAKAV